MAAAPRLQPDAELAGALLPPLPYSLALACFSRLPADERLRLRAVEPQHLLPVLRRCPTVRELHAGIDTHFLDEACRVLRCEGEYGPMKVTTLYLDNLPRVRTEEALDALMMALRSHTTVRSLYLRSVDLSGGDRLRTLVDTALANGDQLLSLAECGFQDACLPQLARLLRDTRVLRKLTLSDDPRLFADAAQEHVHAFAAALRECHALATLKLKNCGLFAGDAAAGMVVLRGVARHASLQTLDLFSSDVPFANRAAVGAALATLLDDGASPPALKSLHLSFCRLGDEGLAPLAAALSRCTHLQGLYIGRCGASDAFIATQLLPAVQSNTSLRDLRLTSRDIVDDPASVVESLVAMRKRFGR